MYIHLIAHLMQQTFLCTLTDCCVHLQKFSVAKVDLEGSADKTKSVEDRKYVIDAVLVRIMKSRKKMKFEELISEALRQLTFFKAEVRDVRRAIESLIGREYFERDDDAADVLNYLA